jgi:hypothetical protein
MGNFRDIKRKARRSVHDTMSIPALYLAYTPLDSASDEPVSCNVRVHTKKVQLGDQAGVSFQYAEAHEIVPKVIFDRLEVAPARHGVVVVAEGEAYLIDNLLPVDEGFQTAEVVRLSDSEADGLPFPEA